MTKNIKLIMNNLKNIFSSLTVLMFKEIKSFFKF